ncbi:STAS domain-containing protein [Nonomuraea fuscirosea]|uniref:STAS domain-containing protein n=1 Tax=Nonomuraea fuscirosea TaxID=1291556 RepID=UPI0037A3903D
MIMALSAQVSQDRNLVVVALTGELDVATASDLLRIVDAALTRESPNLLLDASGLRFCDSHGLEALLAVRDKVTRAGGHMELSHVNGRVRNVLAITGLSHAFVIT